MLKRSGELVELLPGKLNFKQRAEVKRICEEKIQIFIEKRGLGVWDYRLLDAAVPDSLRYRVLKEGKGRCALCGITKEESPLHVDHIIPLNKGGKTEYESLQVLCVKCNCSKRDTDATDFREMPAERQENCVFCQAVARQEVVASNELAVARADKFPVTGGHTLIIPRRHASDYFDTSAREQAALFELVRVIRRQQMEKDHKIKGFNVGINAGTAAGQTVGHCHVQVIPQRAGDNRVVTGVDKACTMFQFVPSESTSVRNPLKKFRVSLLCG